jgi:hypothetical protein
MLTKTALINMIETADQEKLARIVGRACVALFRRQTEDEKVMNTAKHNNNRGFTQADARQGSITAKYFIKNGTLLEWQINQWLKTDVRGTPRIVKYWKQLAEEAAKKAA